MLKEFKAFLMRGNVIDLAVAVIVGAAFTQIVNAIVEHMITPLVGMIFSKNFTALDFTINDSTFGYGFVIDAAIKFVAVGAVVFFVIVKPVSVLQARRKAGVVEETDVPPTEAELLTEIRDLLAARQG